LVVASCTETAECKDATFWTSKAEERYHRDPVTPRRTTPAVEITPRKLEPNAGDTVAGNWRSGASARLRPERDKDKTRRECFGS